MDETKVEYYIEKSLGLKKQWDRVYVWASWDATSAGTTSDLDVAKQKLVEFREWAELNNFNCQYRIVKTTITTEVLDG